ncbi:MAG TPA: peptide ABC transporter substrate-binding protein [Thermoflexia bacterium]|nr:peptide ABC transporter substrate-binding protein [Thermoflexia bacterium]
MKYRSIATVALLLIALIMACQSPTPTVTPDAPSPSPSPSPPPSPTPAPTSTPTPTPPKEFTICQAEEPNTLFIYGGPSRAARNVLQAIYDGPIDTRMYQFQPVILEKVPSLADGDATLRIVHVQEGDKVVDVNGLAVDLFPGVTVFNAAGQEVTFESGVITMTQMVVTFTLRADVTWADGQPLTADDSRYSFELAGEFDNPTNRLLLDRTSSYKVVDERTIVWTGVPGYRDPFYFLNFYHPLPRHLWGVADAARLLNAEVAHRKPLGWGPFVVEEWVEGDHITLVRNPHYFRASEGLPHLDRVTFRFVPDLRRALDLLVAGECDLVTQDVIEGGDVAPLLDAADAGMVQLVTSPSSEWEHLDFGIEPATWVRRSNFFGDVRVRQAIALCVDRERIAREAFPYGGAVVADSYVAPNHPLYAGDRLYRWHYAPPAGRSLLEEVGWRDEDGDGIREAHGVAGIANGTPFTVTLLTTDDNPARERTARILAEDLAACGIGLAVQYLPAEELFADGPDGPLFGRQFDLALFSWLNGLDAPCGLYLSSEIPGPENWWATSNNPGYASDDYDVACQAALNALTGTEDHARFHLEAQRIFSHDLPALPLYFAPKLVAVRPEVSGVILDPSEYLELWNIEAFDLIR